MKKRPIIMIAESVRAILAGNKTQTRRVFKNPPESMVGWDEGLIRLKDSQLAPLRFCPYGCPGDRLWVRETTWINGGYVASDAPSFKNEGKRPSIFMRKAVSRITLEILNVRVEKLNDIDNEDALAEGIDPAGYGETVLLLGMNAIPAMSRSIFDFAVQWNKINDRRGFGWHQNPWVWVVEFEALLPDRIEDGRDERMERDSHDRTDPVS